ncbi:MAG TPA: hypothetical protein VHU92_24560 [Streptosporangiaceae bacterium]|nr:hypothetical protein [Streptosporangiaceae bacterium]
MNANAAVQDWATQHGVTLESSPDERRWQGRLGRYLTGPPAEPGPSAEPDPSRWPTEVAYLVSD